MTFLIVFSYYYNNFAYKWVLHLISILRPERQPAAQGTLAFMSISARLTAMGNFTFLLSVFNLYLCHEKSIHLPTFISQVC